jgi:competence protein ComEA
VGAMPTVDLRRPELLVYAVCAVLVVGLGWRVLRSEEATPSSAAAAASSSTAPVSVSAPPTRRATVHVVGAVHDPGVYRLTDGARVKDAIGRAGGATGRADLQAINLAAKVADGQQVVVPRRGTAPAAAAVASAGPGAGASSAPVNLNSATAEQLDTLDGVGPSTAQKILDFRTAHGGFSSVEDRTMHMGRAKARCTTSNGRPGPMWNLASLLGFRPPGNRPGPLGRESNCRATVAHPASRRA